MRNPPAVEASRLGRGVRRFHFRSELRCALEVAPEGLRAPTLFCDPELANLKSLLRPSKCGRFQFKVQGSESDNPRQKSGFQSFQLRTPNPDSKPTAAPGSRHPRVPRASVRRRSPAAQPMPPR